MDKNLCDETVEKIIKPTLLAMKKLGAPYKGVLYAGLMITKDGPKLIEYNVRFGDPECQVIIPRLRNDLLELITRVKNQSLCDVTLKWDPNFAITIVMSSEGYPGYYENGYEIIGLEKASNVNNVEIYHAGTKKNKNKIVTNGGRVLNINGYGKTLKMAKDNAMEAVELINWTGCYYRKDIGWRALEKKRDE
jgi:phosphoribosylamine--glycine ligase